VPKHDRALAGYRDEGGTLRGYALAIYRADLPVTERYLEIDELVWTTPAARRGLYAWIASLGDQWREVLVRALPEQRLGDWIREPRLPAGSAPLWQLWAPAATLMAGTMFRIVDMQQAWRQRTCAAGSAFDITVNVQDMQVPRNARAWRLIADAGRVHIEAGRSNDSVLLLDISTLSRIYIGAMTATAAVQAGRAECTDPAVLSRLDLALALPQPWTFERF
jgi:predicted acetyltransferase